ARRVTARQPKAEPPEQGTTEAVRDLPSPRVSCIDGGAMPVTRCALPIALAVLVLAACSGSDPEPEQSADAGAADAPATTGGAGPAVVGAFNVKLVAPEGGSAGHVEILGQVKDGPNPEGLVWEERRRDGDCRLLEPRVPFCNTPCGGGAICV